MPKYGILGSKSSKKKGVDLDTLAMGSRKLVHMPVDVRKHIASFLPNDVNPVDVLSSRASKSKKKINLNKLAMGSHKLHETPVEIRDHINSYLPDFPHHLRPAPNSLSTNQIKDLKDHASENKMLRKFYRETDRPGEDTLFMPSIFKEKQKNPPVGWDPKRKRIGTHSYHNRESYTPYMHYADAPKTRTEDYEYPDDVVENIEETAEAIGHGLMKRHKALHHHHVHHYA
jgi:hypothetical protein